MATDMNHKYQLYCLLYDISKRKDTLEKALKLPWHRIPWLQLDHDTMVIDDNSNMQIPSDDEPVDIPDSMSPQVSFFQVPILEFVRPIVKNMSHKFTREELYEYL